MQSTEPPVGGQNPDRHPPVDVAQRGQADVADAASRAAEPAPGSAGPVADALRALGELDAAPLAEHPDIYQRIHADLQDALAGIDGA